MPNEMLYYEVLSVIDVFPIYISPFAQITAGEKIYLACSFYTDPSATMTAGEKYLLAGSFLNSRFIPVDTLGLIYCRSPFYNTRTL